MLLGLLEAHIPQFFAPAERLDFAAYLLRESDDYYVVEEHGEVIAGGGINYLPARSEARISWDVVHPDYQGTGVGSRLVLFRLKEIYKQPAIKRVVVRTSQMAFRFYEKFGFQLVQVEKDFWAKGYDLYEMHIPYLHNTS